MKINQSDMIIVKQNVNVNQTIKKNEVEDLEKQYKETEKIQNEILKKLKELKKSVPKNKNKKSLNPKSDKHKKSPKNKNKKSLNPKSDKHKKITKE